MESIIVFKHSEPLDRVRKHRILGADVKDAFIVSPELVYSWYPVQARQAEVLTSKARVRNIQLGLAQGRSLARGQQILLAKIDRLTQQETRIPIVNTAFPAGKIDAEARVVLQALEIDRRAEQCSTPLRRPCPLSEHPLRRRRLQEIRTIDRCCHPLAHARAHAVRHSLTLPAAKHKRHSPSTANVQ